MAAYRTDGSDWTEGNETVVAVSVSSVVIVIDKTDGLPIIPRHQVLRTWAGI